jgi:MoxR-like ATPase
MLGTPGTAKSYLVRKFSEAFPTTDSKTTSIPFFEVGLNGFTKPEDVFGPIDVQKWKNDSELVYKSENFLPNARIAFVDELSRGESVLNSLLTIVNERTFNVNGIAKKVPLEMCVSATNFKLNSVEMEAMRDRFLQWLNPKKLVEEDDLVHLWMSGDKSVTVRISEEEVAQVRAEVESVKLDVDVLRTFKKLLDCLNKECGVILSDRRTKMMIKLIKAAAWYNGHSTIQDEDLKDVWTCCWTDEQDILKIKSVIKRIADYQAYEIGEIMSESMDVFTSWKLVKEENRTMEDTNNCRNVIQNCSQKFAKIKNVKASNKADYQLCDVMLKGFGLQISQWINKYGKPTNI